MSAMESCSLTSKARMSSANFSEAAAAAARAKLVDSVVAVTQLLDVPDGSVAVRCASRNYLRNKPLTD